MRGRSTVQHALDHAAVEQCCRFGIFLLESVGRRAERLVGAAVKPGDSLVHEPIRAIERRPCNEESKRQRRLLVRGCNAERLLLGVEILEVRQPLEIGTQMLDAQRPLEMPPTERLCLVLAPERFERRNPEIGLGTVLVFGMPTRAVEPCKCLGRALRCDQPLRDIDSVRALHSTGPNRPDVGVRVLLKIGQDRQSIGERAMPLLRAPLPGWRGQGSERRLGGTTQFGPPCRSECLAEMSDEGAGTAEPAAFADVKHPVGKSFGIAIGPRRDQPAEIDHRLVEYVFDLADIIAHAVGYPIRDADEVPQLLDRALRTMGRQGSCDRGPKMIELLDQRLAFVPIDEGSGPADRLDAFADLGRKPARAFRAGSSMRSFLRKPGSLSACVTSTAASVAEPRAARASGVIDFERATAVLYSGPGWDRY